MNLKPLSDRVILKALEAEEKTKGGIILTANAKEKPEMAEVVAVGPGGVVDGKRASWPGGRPGVHHRPSERHPGHRGVRAGIASGSRPPGAPSEDGAARKRRRLTEFSSGSRV